MNWKIALNKLPGLFGYEVRRIHDPARPLKWLSPKTVLDVGANEGQFYREARKCAPASRIICFEPLPGAADALRILTRNDRALEVAQIALGSREGEMAMHVNAYSPSSSLLPPRDCLGQTFPHAAQSSLATVRVETLDGWMQGRALTAPVLLKLDVQGYELEVLRGGEDTLKTVDAVLAEVSFMEFYAGQCSFLALTSFLAERRFEFADFYYFALDQRGLPAFADALYLKSSAGALSDRKLAGADS
jgi:FkbM family methyltransferase